MAQVLFICFLHIFVNYMYIFTTLHGMQTWSSNENSVGPSLSNA